MKVTETVLEEKAREKWCPFAINGGGAINRTADNVPLTKCIGSRCMAWRIAPQPDGTASGEGYCGLAGPPGVKP